MYVFFEKILRPAQHIVKNLVFGCPIKISLKMEYENRIEHCEIAKDEPPHLKGNPILNYCISIFNY